MSEVARQALARDLARRLLDLRCSVDELRVIGAVADRLERMRLRPWERRIPTGPGDVDRYYHLTTIVRGSVVTGCNGRWPIIDAVERVASPLLADRCDACWRSLVRSHAVDELIVEVALALAAEDRAHDDQLEGARAELVNEWNPDQKTVASVVPERIAVALSDIDSGPYLAIKVEEPATRGKR